VLEYRPSSCCCIGSAIRLKIGYNLRVSQHGNLDCVKYATINSMALYTVEALKEWKKKHSQVKLPKTEPETATPPKNKGNKRKQTTSGEKQGKTKRRRTSRSARKKVMKERPQGQRVLKEASPFDPPSTTTTTTTSRTITSTPRKTKTAQPTQSPFLPTDIDFEWSTPTSKPQSPTSQQATPEYESDDSEEEDSEEDGEEAEEGDEEEDKDYDDAAS